MKFGHLIEYDKRNIFLQKSCWKCSSSSFFLKKKKSFIQGKRECSGVLLHYISIALKLAFSKKELHRTLVYSSRDILQLHRALVYSSRDIFNFDVLEKDLGIVFPPHFVYDFSTEMFLMLYSINWPNFIVWLPLVLEILGNMCIAIDC